MTQIKCSTNEVCNYHLSSVQCLDIIRANGRAGHSPGNGGSLGDRTESRHLVFLDYVLMDVHFPLNHMCGPGQVSRRCDGTYS